MPELARVPGQARLGCSHNFQLSATILRGCSCSCSGVLTMEAWHPFGSAPRTPDDLRPDTASRRETLSASGLPSACTPSLQQPASPAPADASASISQTPSSAPATPLVWSSPSTAPSSSSHPTISPLLLITHCTTFLTSLRFGERYPPGLAPPLISTCTLLRHTRQLPQTFRRTLRRRACTPLSVLRSCSSRPLRALRPPEPSPTAQAAI